MTALSPRFAAAAAALFLAAAVPVWFHALSAPTYDDCRDPDRFFAATRLGGAQMEVAKHRSRASRATEGRLHARTRNAVRVRAFRTYEPSRLYASPMSFGFDSMSYLVPRETRWLETGDDILPVHWSSYEMEGIVHIEAYAYIQGGMPTWHPLQSGVALALPQLVEGTRPLTVLIVSGTGRPDEVPALEVAVEGWFVDAWRQLKVSCDS